MSMNRPVATALAAALCLLTAACGSSSDDRAGDTTTEAAASKTGYPVTLDNCGRKETFKKAPSRVVVMNGASVAEVSTLLALGLGDRIVANQQGYGMSEVPGRAAAIKKLPTGDVKVNEAYDIPREAMLGLRPDLVLSVTTYGFDEKNGFATRDQLGQVGANSYVSPQGCDDDPSKMTLADSYRLLRDMGKVFNVRDRAEKLIAASGKNIAAVSAKVKGEKKPKVMVLFSNMSMGGNDFSSVLAHGIVNDILAKAGASNAFSNTTKATFADLSKEKVAATDVDAVVVISYNDPDPAAYARKLLKEFPQWPAARNNTYVTLSDSMYLGPSNDLAVERIAKMLHPDAL
ncbi:MULTISPECIES: ABC transporter substrate-binding protein [Streptomyces]|uniref:ABC transporter iron(III)/siderophore-binding protein n=1 Tax=Streptomyces sviceus (strain ATCC 29083 / DSM 924 / JCM 4929 / NBRC 13980 / NCIMB 11184 / NRRL 5439 / UC 5370) TaxID=463191 RepID=B5I5M6_STRX2|nr:MULTISPECIES: ABC transporter substrate-binding protein [Streptomyces]EDY60381.2 ABC transporter iron(III)/siderophore-binding protein [Streptomyces sviceus ATCC 29083]MYT09436.1 ABC transporter substrate-binding protein [Streptomyces sp. SID5470]